MSRRPVPDSPLKRAMDEAWKAMEEQRYDDAIRLADPFRGVSVFMDYLIGTAIMQRGPMKGRFVEAEIRDSIECLSRALAKFPPFADALLNRGMARSFLASRGGDVVDVKSLMEGAEADLLEAVRWNTGFAGLALPILETVTRKLEELRAFESGASQGEPPGTDISV